ncbi:hypothetical protein AURDEDRAFT_183443 [Auricularia subglabra TFB-10046 SS5]|nr:hypothetical protein AURDEDRAFT_183443 [Auricularia subglabra TFB-10046 SS5]
MAGSQVAVQAIGFGVAILGGQVLLPILIATILFAPGVRRNPLLVNLLLPWVMYSVGVCLLLYTGHLDEKEPPRKICYAQLLVTLGALVMASAALVSYAISLYSSAPRGENGSEANEVSMRSTYLLTSLPVIGVIGYEISLLHIFQQQWDELSIERDILVCTIRKNHEVMRVVEAIAAGSTLVAVVLTVDLLCRYGAGLKHVLRGRAGYRELVLAPARPWKRVLIRLAVFEVYCAFALVACLVLMSGPSRPLRQAMWAFADSGERILARPLNRKRHQSQPSLWEVPLAAFSIFGTAPDIIKTWRFWRRDPSPETEIGQGESA